MAWWRSRRAFPAHSSTRSAGDGVTSSSKSSLGPVRNVQIQYGRSSTVPPRSTSHDGFSVASNAGTTHAR